MGNNFSTCLLVQENSTTPVFEVAKGELTPGATHFLDRANKNILLAGGFSSISPNTTFPLSPTLQLNFDLSLLSAEALTEIARAELDRINAVDYRSYVVEADNRVCVIGKSGQQIQNFINTYGGLLEINPLLVHGHDPEIDTAVELTIEEQDGHCLLEYQVRSPIAKEKCNYCGKCGPSCPEQCLSEILLIDFNSCTFCKECEQVCETGAIDIHGAVSKRLEVPAIIVLGDIELDVPTGTSNIYPEEALPAYFSTLFPCQIDETVTCDNSRCQYSPNLSSGCGYCLSSCSFGAISRDAEGVHVDSLKCEECGACVAACPTGALQNQRSNDKSFFDFFQKVTIPENATVVIGNEACLHQLWWRQQGNHFKDTLFLHYEMAESLSLFHFLFLLSRGAKRVAVMEFEDQKTALPPSLKQIDLASEIFKKLFDIEYPVVRCKVQDFNDLMTLPKADNFDVVIQESEFINRRQSLTVALKTLVKESGRELTLKPETYTPFATVTCNSELCTQCMACLGDCRIEAMIADEDNLSLNHLGALCVGCGLCVQRCPEKALTLSPACTMGENFFTPVEMAKAEPMTCTKCGKVFGTRKSFERVMAILSTKENVDTSHFKMCDTCRVVKIFEAQ